MTAVGPEVRTIGAIQVLRGVAATSVVFHHAVRAFSIYHAAGPGHPTLFGAPPFSSVFAIGVDVFFVISGFIMSYISGPYRAGEKSPFDFLSRRVIRIYPMYLLATLLCIAFLSLHWSMSGAPRPFDLNPGRILSSLAFVPSFNAAGEIQPVLGVGWTLYYEMYFYLMLAAMLVISKRNAMLPLALVLLAICVGANLLAAVGWRFGAVGGFLRSTQIFDFLFGLALAELFSRGRLPRLHPAAPIALALAWLAFAWPIPPENLEFLFWGVPAALLVLAFLLLEQRRPRTWPRASMIFGDASYAIYLFHTTLIYDVLLFALQRLRVLRGDGLALDVWIVVCTAAATLGGLAAHVIVERPLTRWLRRGYATVALRRAAA